jgi:molybdate transport system permease protein
VTSFDLSPLWISLKTSAAATLLTFVLGLAAARAVAGWRSRARGLLDGILTLPLVLPPTVAGFFLLLIFGRASAIGRALEAIGMQVVFSWPATVIAATVVAFPLMYRTALGAFEQVSPNLLGAARTLGAGEWRTFRRVLVPLAWPGIMAGTVLAFARALGEFGATLMLAGNIPGRTQTMPVAIFFAAEAGDMRRAVLWVVFTAAMSLASIAALHYWATPARAPRTWDVPDVTQAHGLPAVAAAGGVPSGSAAVRVPLEVDITRRYPAFDLSVRFSNRARTLGLLGASGSGKSLTLAAIAGLETPDAGIVVLDGRVLYDSKTGVNLRPAARRIGLVFQDYALFPHLSVRENIAFGLHGLPDGERARRVAEYAQLARIDALLDRYPPQLSGGQRQRVALARALAMRPDALLLDEPFSGLDPHLRRSMEEDLRAVLAGYSGAIVLVTHDRSEAYRMCDELVVLSEGAVAAAGPRHDLFARPETLAAARVTGCKNLAAIHPAGPGEIAVPAWGCTLRVPAVPPGAAYAGIRAHHIRLLAASGADPNTFPCSVLDVVESPFEVTVYLAIGEGRLEAELPSELWPPLAEKPRLWAHIPAEKLLLVRPESKPRA